MHSTNCLIEKKGWSKTHHDSHPLRAGALAAQMSAPPVGLRDGSLYGISGHPLVRNETLLSLNSLRTISLKKDFTSNKPHFLPGWNCRGTQRNLP